jgi:hypothetical protein
MSAIFRLLLVINVTGDLRDEEKVIIGFSSYLKINSKMIGCEILRY